MVLVFLLTVMTSHDTVSYIIYIVHVCLFKPVVDQYRFKLSGVLCRLQITL